MSNSLKFVCVSIFGILVAVLVAAVNALIAYLTGFSLFGMTIWVFVPVGAILVGIAATSGYLLGCLIFQLRPQFLLFAQMFVVAALTNLLIYYFEYLAVIWEERPDLAANAEAFALFLQNYLGHQQMSFRGSSMGEVGEFGYLLAFIDFVGFLVGGSLGVVFLKGMETCKTCELLLRRVAQKERRFADRRDASRYFNGLYALAPDSPEFAARSDLGSPRGKFKIRTTLLECPKCKGQIWKDEAWDPVPGQTNTKAEELTRWKAIPAGIDMTPLLRNKAPAAKS
jgi:hypothetical protein